MTEQAARTPRRPGLPLGRPLGIPVYLAPSWLLIAALIAWETAHGLGMRDGAGTPSAGEFAAGAVIATALAASVLAHELGHSIVSLALGIPIRRITLFLFGGYAEISRESRTPAEEYLVAIAGPLVSLFLGGVAAAVFFASPEDSALQYVMGYLAGTNAILAVLNLLPGLPLDGGRVLRAVIWERTGRRELATRVAVLGGQGLAVLLAVAGGSFLVAGDAMGGALTLLLAGFLWANAVAAGRQSTVAGRVPDLRARALAHPALPVPTALPLAEALRRGDEARSWLVTVDSYGRPAGLVSAAAVRAVPEARRPWVTVGEVCRTLAPGLVLPADLTGQAVVEAMRTTPASEYLVVEPDGAVVGVLAAYDVARQVDPRRAPVGSPA